MSTRVAITLSEPWDMVTECGSGPFAGTVRDVISSRLLVELDQPLTYSGQTFEFALCQVRHVGTRIDDLLSSSESPTGIGLFIRSTLLKPRIAAVQAQKGVGALGTVRKLS